MEKDSQENIDLIRKTVGKDATNEEFQTLMYLSREYNLDPLKKEIWFIKYGGKATIITSRDGYLKVANACPYFDGLEGDVVYSGDKLTKRDNGSILIEYGEDHLVFDKTKLVGAYCNVYRKDRSIAISVFVNLKDYHSQTPIWMKYTNAMILKVAESMALKRAFSLSGLVTAEEIEESKEDSNIDILIPKNISEKKLETHELSKAIAEGREEDLPEELRRNRYITKEQENSLRITLRSINETESSDIVRNILKKFDIQNLKFIPYEEFDDIQKWVQSQIKIREENKNRNEMIRAKNG